MSETGNVPGPRRKATPRWRMDATCHEAARLLAEDELTDQEIADKLDIHRDTLWGWKKRAEFAAKVKEHEDNLGAVAKRHAIARRSRRLQAQGVRWQKLHQVIQERAVDPRMAQIPGGTTGMLVIEEVEVVLIRAADGVGPPSPVAVPTKVAVDTATLKELREIEKQAAIEVGQWAEKREYNITELDTLIAAGLAQLAAGCKETPPGADQG